MKQLRLLQGLQGQNRLGDQGARDSLGYLEGREALMPQAGLGLQDSLGFPAGLVRLPPRQVLDTQ